MYKRAAYSIMELMLLWISKRLLKNRIIAPIYIDIFIISPSCVYSNNFVHFFFGADQEL